MNIHENIFNIIRELHISEKSTFISDKYKQFTFKVQNTAEKKEIKRSIEYLYKVKVKNIHVINMKGKKKKFNNKYGIRKNWKKVFVILHKGFDINLNVSE